MSIKTFNLVRNEEANIHFLEMKPQRPWGARQKYGVIFWKNP